MIDSNVSTRKALLCGLDESLAEPLANVLQQCGCSVADADVQSKVDIVFCPRDLASLRHTLARFAKLPVVVVSRLPDVEGWLDALEAGAADYCAAPFEATQLRWLLDTHARPSQTAFAAA